MKAEKLQNIINEEISTFIGKLNEKKVTAKQVDKIQKELLNVTNALKDNFPNYKNAKDEKKKQQYAKIAVDLTKRKKYLEIQLDRAISSLYSDVELELKELDVRKTHGDKRIENPKTGNKIKLRTALKAKKGTEVRAKARKIYNNLKESSYNASAGGGDVDDGPQMYHASQNVFKAKSDKEAKRIGYTVLNYLSGDKEFNSKDRDTRFKGDLALPTYFPAGVPGEVTTMNPADYAEGTATRKWVAYTNKVAKMIGYGVLNYMGAESSTENKNPKKEKKDNKNSME